jgi:hypothetical protein
MSVRIFPRRKAGQNTRHNCPEKTRAPLKIDVNTIQPLFGLPQKDAARILNISVTALKKVCRKLGFHRWSCSRKTTAVRAPAVRVGPAGSPIPEWSDMDLMRGLRSAGSPIPEWSDMDLMRGNHSDYATSALVLLSSPSEQPREALAADIRLEETFLLSLLEANKGKAGCLQKNPCSPWHDSDSDDLAYLVALPGLIDVPEHETYTTGWLSWYEESSKSFEQ